MEPFAHLNMYLDPPLFQAHRGYCAMGALENTLASIQAAQDRGASMVEVDVCLTRDQVPVLLHDSDLKRVFDSEEVIHRIDAAELYRHGEITLLKEALNSFRGINFNIELKHHPGASLPGLVQAVAQVLRTENSLDQCLVSSFRPDALRLTSKLLPGIPLGFLVGRESRIPGWALPGVFKWSRAHWLHLQNEMLDLGVVQKWRNRAVPIAAWTINDPNRARDLLAVGVRSIISDVLLEADI